MISNDKKLASLAALCTLFGASAIIAMDPIPTAQNKAQQLAILKCSILQGKQPHRTRMNCYDCSDDHLRTTHMHFTPDGRYLIEARKMANARVAITDSNTHQEQRCNNVENIVDSIACNDNHLVIGAFYNSEHKLFVLNLLKRDLVGNFSGQVQGNSIGAVALHQHASDFVTSSAYPRKLIFHEGHTGKVKYSYDEDVSSLYYSPCGKHLISANFEKITLRDGSTGVPKKELLVPYNIVAWNPDSSNFAVVCHEEKDNLFICDGTTGEMISAITDTWDRTYGVGRNVLFSPKGHYLITIATGNHLVQSHQGTIIIRDGKTFEIIDSIPNRTQEEAVAVSYDDTYLVFTADIATNNILLYDLKSRQIIIRLTGDHPQIIRWRPGCSQFVCAPQKGCNVTWWNLFDKETDCALRELEDRGNEEEIDFVYKVNFGMASAHDQSNWALYGSLPESVKTFVNKVDINSERYR